MPNRILKDSICTSVSVDALSSDEEIFFYRLIVNCDDYGLMDARTSVLRAKLYPLQIDNISNDDITRWLARLAELEIVEVYEVDGRPYLHMATWERHQQVRAQRAKYPRPPKLISDDIKGNQEITLAPVIQSESNPNSNPNPVRTIESADSIAVLPHAPFLTFASFSERLRAAKPNRGAILAEAVSAVYGIECREFSRLAKLASDHGAGEVLKLVFSLVTTWNGIDNPVDYLTVTVNGRATQRKAGKNDQKNGRDVLIRPGNHQADDLDDDFRLEPLDTESLRAELEAEALAARTSRNLP